MTEKITDENKHLYNFYTAEHAIRDARYILFNSHSGALATCVREGEDLAGYPFNSVTSFMLDEYCCPIMFGAGISEHAKNSRANGKASLLLRDVTKSHRVETGWRLTIQGDVDHIEASEALSDAFFRYYPHMRSYQKMHDFGFSRLNPKKMYIVMDFAKISWVDPEAIKPQVIFDNALKVSAIEHMNADHVDSMLHYLALLNVDLLEKKKPRLVNFHQFGLTMHYNQRLYYLSFTKPITKPDEIRQAFADLAHTPLSQ